MLLEGMASIVLSRGASELYGHCYPSRKAYYASIRRLKERGLIVQSAGDGNMPSIRLSDEGKKQVPAYYNPEQFWRMKWNGLWYVLMFDVPEINRSYRDELRRFLKGERFGCLQRSVWVTPRDVRAEYDDLDRAAAVDTVAFLLESRTVLGYGDQSLVLGAWNFEEIQKVQEAYCRFAENNLSVMEKTGHSDAELIELLRMEDQAYCQAMSADPLLPEKLFPAAYLGRRVYENHLNIRRQILERLS